MKQLLSTGKTFSHTQLHNDSILDMKPNSTKLMNLEFEVKKKTRFVK